MDRCGTCPVDISIWNLKCTLKMKRFVFAFQEPQLALMTCSVPDLFDNYMQQDAHEFLNYLLNTIADILQEEKKQEKQNGKLKNGNMNEPAENNKPELTWVHEIFQGTLTNETRCLNCETVSTGRACAELAWVCPSGLRWARVCCGL